MPVTAGLFLVGSAAISALPPLNGFVSEWLTFQAILLSPQLPEWGLARRHSGDGRGPCPCRRRWPRPAYVRAFGVAFLGRPRSDRGRGDAREVDVPGSAAAMGLLALACLVVGILPGLFLDLLAPVPKLLTSARLEPQFLPPWLSLVPVAESRSTYNGLLLALFIAFSAIVPALLLRRFGATATRRAPAWDCGTPSIDPC